MQLPPQFPMKLYRRCQDQFQELCPDRLRSARLLPKRGYALVSIALITSILVASCGESRVSQCNKLTAIANKAVTLTAPSDTADLVPLADNIDQIKNEIQSIAIQENRLKDLQTQLVGMYSEVSLSLRAKAQGTTAKDANAVNKSIQDLAAATAKENTIVDEINGLCNQ
jgi:hypothetical protein